MRPLVLCLLALAAGACSAPQPREASRPDAARRGTAGCDATLPADYPTIAEAVDALGDGATICLDAGTFTGQASVGAMSITLRGAGAGSTLLDGDDTVGPLSVYGGGSLVVEDLSIVNGAWGVGGCVYVSQGSLTLRHVEVRGCAANDYDQPFGGGVAVVGGTLLMQDVDLAENQARDGRYSGAGGGLALLGGATARLVDVRVTDNKVNGDWAESSRVGGGIYVGDGSRLFGRRLVVTGNRAASAPWVRGGGVAVDSGTAILLNSVVAGNRIATGYDVYGAGLDVARGHLALRSVTVHGNQISNLVLGGGGGIASYDASLRLQGCALTENQISWTEGDPETLGLALAVFHGTRDLRYSDLYNEGATTLVAGVDSPVGSAGNVSVAPDYVDVSGTDEASWDLHLNSSSALIDAGDPALLEQDGSAADIGAYGGPGAAGW